MKLMVTLEAVDESQALWGGRIEVRGMGRRQRLIIDHLRRGRGARECGEALGLPLKEVLRIMRLLALRFDMAAN
jgi:hypothetical protein